MGVQWDPKLIGQAEAYALAGAHPVRWADHDEGAGVLLRCVECGQSCGLWAKNDATTADDVLAGVLRHLVMAHDMPLNKAARKRWEVERADGAHRDGQGRGRRWHDPDPAAGRDPGPGPGPAADHAPGDRPG